MTTLREAAQQALEALEGKRYTACGWKSDCDKAIATLRAALAEPVQEPFGYFRAEPFGWTDCAATDEGAIPLYTAPPQRPAEPVQEPVAWRTQNATPPGGYVVFQQYPQGVVDLGGVVEPLYTAPPQRKENSDE